MGLNECSARSTAEVHRSSSAALSAARTVVIVLGLSVLCEETVKTCSNCLVARLDDYIRTVPALRTITPLG